jgi:hypothetical protein
LVLASAERADVLVDFSDVAAGTTFNLLNTATAPFDGTFADPATAGRVELRGLPPYPEVLRLRMIGGRVVRRPTPTQLATDLQPIGEDDLARRPVRASALVEQELDGQHSMLTLREFAEDPDETSPPITLIDATRDGSGPVTRLRIVATRFEAGSPSFPSCASPRSGDSSTSPATPSHPRASDPFWVLTCCRPARCRGTGGLLRAAGARASHQQSR